MGMVVDPNIFYIVGKNLWNEVNYVLIKSPLQK
jgi:hypothetical protein